MIYGKLDQAARYMGILPGIDRILKEAGRYMPQDSLFSFALHLLCLQA